MGSDPKVGDLRWCGMCAHVERFELVPMNGGHWWAPYRPKTGETLTTLIQPATAPTPDADNGGTDG